MTTKEVLESIKSFQAGTLSPKDTNLLFKYLIGYTFNNSIQYNLQRTDREELSQNVTIQIFSFLKKNPSADIYTLSFVNIAVKNAFINNYRKQKKLHFLSEEHIPLKTTQHNCFEYIDSTEHIKRTLEECVPKEQYDVFILCMEGYKYEEISKHLDIPTGTVRSRIHRTRQILKDKFKR